MSLVLLRVVQATDLADRRVSVWAKIAGECMWMSVQVVLLRVGQHTDWLTEE